jgi:hypothetical protein
MIKLSTEEPCNFDTMKANNFNVMKGPGGVYWMESMEKRMRTSCSDLLDKFSGPVSDGSTGSCNRR